MLPKEFLLSSNYKMPSIGIGTYGFCDANELQKSLEAAISLGYRHIDTASHYSNEMEIGRVLSNVFESGMRREDFFITTKLWCDSHDRVEEALKKSLKKLNLEYIDLYLIHYPVKYKLDGIGNVLLLNEKPCLDDFSPETVWNQMETLVAGRYARSIGLSNFGIYNTRKVLEVSDKKPAVSQFEVHPYLHQEELVDFCFQNKIQVVSYSSLGGSINAHVTLKKVREDEEIEKIAKRRSKSTSQIILSFLVQNKIGVIPQSKSYVHLKENVELCELDEDDINTIRGIEKDIRYIHPDYLGDELFK